MESILLPCSQQIHFIKEVSVKSSWICSVYDSSAASGFPKISPNKEQKMDAKLMVEISNVGSGLVQFVSFLPRAEDRNNPLMLAAVGELLVKLSFILSRWVYCFFFSLSSSIVITEQKKKMFDNLASILSLETFFDQSSWEKLRIGGQCYKKHNRSVIRSKQAC